MAFDIDKYTANSTAVGWDDLDFDEFDRNPLPASTLRILRYMCDVEYHTVCYLRDLLTTPSHK
ncbi:MAG: ferritin-like domain-containing protein, partial [Rhodoglobus sp.]